MSDELDQKGMAVKLDHDYVLKYDNTSFLHDFNHNRSENDENRCNKQIEMCPQDEKQHDAMEISESDGDVNLTDSMECSVSEISVDGKILNTPKMKNYAEDMNKKCVSIRRYGCYSM